MTRNDVVILGGARTPFGSFGGALKDVSAVELELRRRGGRYGLAALCIGGGQGIAMVMEAFHG